MNTNTIEAIKNQVKSHTVVPFSTADIDCHDNRLIINDKYRVNNHDDVMKTLGLRNNLTEDIFIKPEKNWSEIRSALTNIKSKELSCIVNQRDEVVSIVGRQSKEPTQLNFDDRINQLLDTINIDNDHNFQNITWHPSKCIVQVDTTNRSELDTGAGDFWKFGTSIGISLNNQQYQDFFYRLVCSNGMTTREELAYRSAALTKDIGKQFLAFASTSRASDQVINRCNALRNSRASLFEFNSVANAMAPEHRDVFIPEYREIKADFEQHGINIDNIATARQRLTYTNQNLYDVFNRATNLASHQREVIGEDAVAQLNKVAGKMFIKGPNLRFNLTDIYAGTN